ncbi:unnamed protein product [Rotaria sp. Silwood1]|nr:unnamed protein product [Rotaria sp. Silwood1]
MKTTTINKQLRQIDLNKDTWIIFTKFLIMSIDFYQYTTLIESDINKLFNNKYDIIRKLGSGLTSNVYLLEKNQNNNCLDYGQQCVIKICKQTKYLSLYLNEIKIMKELNISNRFNLFFENIIDSSPTEEIFNQDEKCTNNFILYQNELQPIKVLKLNQSKQLIDIIQYLYDCHIIHRNLEPENLMLGNCRQQLKLIDFNYAKIYQINEMTKPLSIEGSITFTEYQCLHFISHFSLFDSLSSIYDY